MFHPFLAHTAYRHARSLWWAFLSAAVTLVPVVVIISANALRVRNCDFLQGLGFFLLIPVFNSIFATSFFYVLTHLFARWPERLTKALIVFLVIGTLGYSLYVLYREPPIFIYNHLWGYFAGSLYDEGVSLHAPLVYFRLITLVGTLSFCCFLLLMRKRKFRAFAFSKITFLILAIIFWRSDVLIGPRAGYYTDRETLVGILPLKIERPGLVIHMDKNTTQEEQRAIADEHAFRLTQLQQRLQLVNLPVIHSFVYPNAEVKARYMGAKNTMIAKTWLNEIHVHGYMIPHPTIGHELAHVAAASFGSRLLAVSAQYEILVNMGLIEGFAEAQFPHPSELSLEQWSWALKRLDLAPPLDQVLSSSGFWGYAPRRAYTIVGSFVRYLLQTYGVRPFKAVYASGQHFEQHYKKNLPMLIQEWQQWIDLKPCNERELKAAEERFHTPSIFTKTCAHTLATLREQAQKASRAEAVALYEKIVDLSANQLSAALDLTLAYAKNDDQGKFLQSYAKIQTSSQLTNVQRERLLETYGNLAWNNEQIQQAKATYMDIAAMQTSLASERLQWVRLFALKLPKAEQLFMRDYLQGETVPAVALLHFSKSFESQKENACTYGYLSARILVQLQSFTDAILYLLGCQEHPHPPIEIERLRLLAQSYFELKDYDQAKPYYKRYMELVPLSGEKEITLDWLERIDWKRSIQ